MQAKKDQNSVPTATGVSSVDGVTPVSLRVDPATGWLLAETISDSITAATSLNQCRIDQNDVSTIYGVSDLDGTTLIPIRTDSNGYLLAQF